MSSLAASIAPPVAKGRRIATLDITVLAGGPGVEREVSLHSGRMIHDALVRLNHNVTRRDVNPADLSALDIPADVVFIALHGTFGEDGRLQRVLDQRGMVYTGSGAEASALAMDKVRTKTRFIQQGIATPPFEVIEPARVADAVATFVPPVVVKPRDSGSSVDIYLARDREAFESALLAVVSRYGAALVEKYVSGPELTVGVLNGRALPVCEIRTKREFYNYQAKYLDDDTEYVFEIDLPAEVLARVRAGSERAHAALGCRDFSRVDWLIDARTLEPYAIEVNTIPGFTSHSLLPKAAAKNGISYDALCQNILAMCIARSR